MTLPELLDACCDSRSPRHQQAWKEFLERYRELIYYNVAKRCREWNIPRLGFQFQEVVNDVVAEVLHLLCDHNFHALRSFRGGDNESQFRWYLIVICHRASGRFIQKHLRHLADLDPVEMQFASAEMAEDARGQLYEFVVHKLRTSTRNPPKNFERDINIYLLYIWGDFSKDMIVEQPCYKNHLTPKIVDNVVHRLRNILREASTS